MIEADTAASRRRTEDSCLLAARRALLRWADVISAGRLEDVLALYAPDAILVPTLSNEIREREEERRQYFERFLAIGAMRCVITMRKQRVSAKLGTVVIGGLYEFIIERPTSMETVPARFLFTFEEIDGRWLITGHHSSALSEAL